MTVFSKEWFKKYNHFITRVARLPILGELIFNFKKFGHYVDRKMIVEVTPNSVIEFIGYKKGKVELKQHFFVRNEYALRLQSVFYPIWITFHIWDIITRPFPQLNLGFDTLTAYPDASSGSTTCDGFINYSPAAPGETWASVIGASAGNSANLTATEASLFRAVSSSTTNNWVKLERSFFSFDTSSIDDGATISGAVASFYGTLKADNLSISPSINVYLATPASANNLIVGDFDQVGSVAQCDTAKTYSGYSTSGYNDFTFNATGKGNISKTGITKLCIRNTQYDIGATAPTWKSNQASYFYAYYSDNGTNKPKLVVTYTTSTAYTTEITEALALVSSDLQSQILVATITNNLSLTETPTQPTTFNEIINNITSLSQSQTAGRETEETITDNLALIETETNLSVFDATINEALADTETLTAGLSLDADITESIEGTESLLTTLSLSVSIADTTSLSEKLKGNFWNMITKKITSYTNQSKQTTSYDNQVKNKIISRID
jgi:hypothetical protein